MATLTALATVLVICAATQDIAVDGPCAPVRTCARGGVGH
jgi:hypothetical protein